MSQSITPTRVPMAWDTEDDNLHGVEDPATWTEVGAAILARYHQDPGFVREQIADHHDEVDLAGWDFTDPDQLGTWLHEHTDLDTCAWHVPSEVYTDPDPEAAWRIAEQAGRMVKDQPWAAPVPEGYTRIVWVNP